MSKSISDYGATLKEDGNYEILGSEYSQETVNIRGCAEIYRTTKSAQESAARNALLTKVKAKAKAEGKSVDDLMEELLGE